jgi:hypothetical protein
VVNRSATAMANRTSDLTPKQFHFCRCAVSGMKQAAAYREAFDCQVGSLSKTQQESASRLMSRPKIRTRVEALVRQRERGMLASSLSDRERVLTKLRDMMDTEEGGPAVTAQLRAAELLGKSVGLFKDVQVQEVPRSAEEVRAELEELLAGLPDHPDGAVH